MKPNCYAAGPNVTQVTLRVAIVHQMSISDRSHVCADE